MRTVQITAANADEKIKQLYETAFLEDEQIPWKDLMRLIEEMPLDFTAYYDGEEFIGFTISIHVSLLTGSGTLLCKRNCAERAMVSRY